MELALPLDSLLAVASLFFQVPASSQWAESREALDCSLEWVQSSPWNWVEMMPFFSVINAGNFDSVLSIREHSFQIKSSFWQILIRKSLSHSFQIVLFLNACLFHIELKSNLAENFFYVVLIWIYLSYLFKGI